MNISTPEQIKELLHQSLGKVGQFQHCALLDRPGHCNVGDHLIWMGELFYLTDVLKTRINYTANIYNFSDKEMEERIGEAPILLSGGGNLGDLWPDEQDFREKIISKYKDRPIFILPQTIYFTQTENLHKTAKVFNSHPQLTIFVREMRSYEIATKNFDGCRVLMAPDMAFQLVNMPEVFLKPKLKDSWLFLCRQDKELEEKIPRSSLGLKNISVEDWAAFKYKDRQPRIEKLLGWLRLISGTKNRDELIINSWVSRQVWKYFHPYVAKLNYIHDAESQHKSWNLIHHGFYQFSQYPLAITNRLHGHILCLILKIPHIFLPNAYYKNEAFYETWTSQVSFCRFVKSKAEIKPAVQELLELSF
ncbi:MAG: polysaccharide pyruvyl transferase family protein [Coleofasciculaceae cyanobacterium]